MSFGNGRHCRGGCIYGGNSLGGPGTFGTELGQGFPFLDTRAFAEYLEAFIILLMAYYSSSIFCVCSKRYPNTHLKIHNRFQPVPSTSHSSTICSYFHRMLTSLSTGFFATVPPGKQLVVL